MRKVGSKKFKESSDCPGILISHLKYIYLSPTNIIQVLSLSISLRFCIAPQRRMSSFYTSASAFLYWFTYSLWKFRVPQSPSFYSNNFTWWHKWIICTYLSTKSEQLHIAKNNTFTHHVTISTCQWSVSI